jgi:hypothetical protein
MFLEDQQGRLFAVGHQYLEQVGRDTFYGLLATEGDRLFSDRRFEKLYCPDNGRPCTSPSLLMKMLLLQTQDGCSDQEAIDRAHFDLRWKTALNLELDAKPCAKSTFQEFRARLHLNEASEKLLAVTLEEAARIGLLKPGKIKVAIDTTPILGRGAVKDTYNLIADGIKKLAKVLAQLDQQSPQEWAAKMDLSRYWEGSSLKGDANIDWSDERERRVFLNGLAADAQRLLLEADKRLKGCTEPEAKSLKEASTLLRRLVSQDTEPVPPKPGKKTSAEKEPTDGTPPGEDLKGAHPEGPPVTQSRPDTGDVSTVTTSNGPENTAINGVAESNPSGDSTPGDAAIDEVTQSAEVVPCDEAASPEDRSSERVPAADEQPHTREDHLLGQMIQIKQGVAPDRIISASDPEMRHGRKSASKRFDGHKLGIGVDPTTKLILSLDVIAGNAPDAQGALQLVQTAANAVSAAVKTEVEVEKALADCAYGSGETRQEFESAGIELSAKVPSIPANDPFHKGRFVLDLTHMIATCPEGHSTQEYDYVSSKTAGEKVPVARFQFNAETCQACPHKAQCLRSVDKNRGRTVTLHPQEELLQKARRHQETPEFREDIKARQAVEHRFARLTPLGIRQARYFGRKKTRFQCLLAAMVANLTVVATFLPVFHGPLWTLLASRAFITAIPREQPRAA